MPARCVVGGCSNVPNAEQGIALHFIPFSDDERPEAKRRRRQWIRFVNVKRAKWQPTKYSAICSAHFAKEDFTKRFVQMSGNTPRLIVDEVGVVPIPRFYERAEDKPVSSRHKRKLAKESRVACENNEQDVGVSSMPNPELVQPNIEHADIDMPEEATSSLTPPQQSRDVVTQTDGCVSCTELIKERRIIWNKYTTVKAKYEASIKRKRSRGVQCDLTRFPVQQSDDQTSLIPINNTDANHDDLNIVMETDLETIGEAQFENETDEESLDEDVECETEAETETETESDCEAEVKDHRVTSEGTNLRTEPKFVIFLSQLLLLFKFCHHCKTDNPLVEAKQAGTAVVITTTCSNAKCGKQENVWKSQPFMPGTRMYAGNFLLCFAILVSGGSASKVIHMFQHMGLSCISLSTFFQHQRVCNMK